MGYFSNTWRYAHLLIFQKPGKTSMDIVSYMSINLLYLPKQKYCRNSYSFIINENEYHKKREEVVTNKILAKRGSVQYINETKDFSKCSSRFDSRTGAIYIYEWYTWSSRNNVTLDVRRWYMTLNIAIPQLQQSVDTMSEWFSSRLF